MPTPTWDGPPVSPDHVRLAAAICRDSLGSALEADWSIPAGPLTWTCRETLDHINDALAYYCGQLASHASERRPPIRNGDPAASVPDLLDVVVTSGAILAAIATATPADARAYHRMGRADAEGFLAMACEEILVHTWDIAQGFGLPVSVPDDLARAVIHRIFPWAPTERSPWEAQLWCSDRIELPGKGKIGQWGWHAAPLTEWNGQMRPATVFPVES